MSNLSVMWRDQGGSWQKFDVADLQVKTLAGVCYLFTHQKIDVVAQAGSGYVVNNKRLLASYRKKGANAILFDEVLTRAGKALQQPFRDVGFAGLV
jgi:hypothetical protein